MRIQQAPKLTWVCLLLLLSISKAEKTVDISKMYWMGVNDIAGIEIDEIFKKDVLLNEITVNQEENKYSILDIIKNNDFTAIELNIKSKLPRIDMKKILYTNDKGKFVTFSYEDSLERTFLLIMRFSNSTTYTFRIMQMAGSNFQCGEFEYTGTKIYMPCINKLDRMLHICETDYHNDDLSVCTIYSFRIALPIGVSAEDLILRIQMYKNIKGEYLKFVNLTVEEDVTDNIMGRPPNPDNQSPNQNNSILDDIPINPQADGYDFRNHFFYLQKEQNIAYRVPIESFLIDQIYLIASNNYLKERKLLVSGRSGKNLNLMTFNITRGVLDIDSMERGFLRAGIEFYEVSGDKILILDVDGYNNQLEVSVFDLTKLTEKKLIIEKQIELLDSDNKHNMIFLQTRNTRFTVETYIVDMKTGRLFKSEFLKYCPKCTNTIMHMEQQYFLVSLEHRKNDKVLFRVARLNSMNRIFFHQRSKDHINYSASKPQIDANNQVIRTAPFKVFNNKFVKVDYTVAFLEDNYLYYSPRSAKIQGRTFVGFSYYIALITNNLQTDEHDSSLFWFNAIKFQLNAKAKQDFQNIRVMNMWYGVRVFFICKDNTARTWKNFGSPGNQVIPVKAFKQFKLSIPIYEESDKDEDFQYMEWYGEYMVILKKRKELFAFKYGSWDINKPVKVQRLPVPSGVKCMFIEMLMMCFTKQVIQKSQGREWSKSVEARMSLYENKIFYEFFVKSNHLHHRQVSGFIPQLDFLVNGLSFYPSSFEYKSFITFVPSEKKVVKLVSNSKNYTDNDEIVYIKPEWSPYLTFKEIAYSTYIVIYSKQRHIEIWLERGPSTYSYPTHPYIKNFKRIRFVRVLKSIGCFAIIYETITGHIRVAIYIFSAAPMKRLLREIRLDAKTCPEYNTFFEMTFFQNKIYFTYVCSSRQVYRTWVSYFFYGVSLQIIPERPFYNINVGRLDKIFSYVPSNYYKNISVQSEQLVFREMTSKSQILNLESTGILSLKGDVVDVALAEPHDHAKLNQRVTLEDTQYYIHSKPFDTNQDLNINRRQDGEILIVTDEYLISGVQKQYNNFVYSCKFTPFDLNDFFEQNVDTLYTCLDKAGSNLVITDHADFHVRIPTNDRNLISPNLIFIRDYMFIIHKGKGINGAVIEKYLFVEKDLKNPVFISSFLVPCSFQPSLLEVSKVYAMYVNREDKIFVIFDSMQSKGFDIMAYRVTEDFFSKEDYQHLVPDIPGDNFYFLYQCDMKDDQLLCSCYNTNNAYIFRFHYTNTWQVEVKNKVDLFYSLDYIDDYPITFNEHYMVILYRNSELKLKNQADADEEVHEDPNLLIYKLDQPKDENDTNLFFAIYQYEIKEDNFNIVDFELNEEKGVTFLYLLMKKTQKGSGKKKTLVMKKFLLSEYSLEYDLGSYKYRDTASFIATDLLGNKIEFTLELMLKVNLKIYLFLFMAVAFGLILIVMIVIYFLKRKQIRKLKEKIHERTRLKLEFTLGQLHLGEKVKTGLEKQLEEAELDKSELSKSQIEESKNDGTNQSQSEPEEGPSEQEGRDRAIESNQSEKKEVSKEDSPKDSVQESMDERVIG